MDPLNALKTRLDGFLEAFEGIHYRYDIGLSVELPLNAVRTTFPEFGRSESFHAAREAATNARLPDADRFFFQALVPFLAQQVPHARATRALEEIHALEAQQQVGFLEELQPVREARHRLRQESSTERRTMDGQALGAFLLAHRGPYARRVEQLLEGVRSLGFDSGATLRETLLGEKDAELKADALALLSETEDAYRDVLGYVLRKLDTPLRALPHGNAQWTDALAAGVSPFLLNVLPPREGAEVMPKWLLEWGLHPTADGHLRVEAEPRDGKRASPFVHAVRVPVEIRVGFRPRLGGLPEYGELAEAFGEALRLGSIPSEAGLAERRLYEPRVARAMGGLFSLAVGREGWHRRYLGAGRAAAKETARLMAFFALFRLRSAAARALFHLELETRGPSTSLADAFAGTCESALFVRIHRGHALERPALGMELFSELRAGSLGSAVERWLERTYDEDYFRNPAASAWLKSRWRSVQRDGLDGWNREVGTASAAEAGRSMMRALAA